MRYFLAPALLLVAGAAEAAPSFSAEVVSDARRRGLSWSEGKPALEASAYLPLGRFSLSAAALTTRGSTRHGGADAAFDAGAWVQQDVGILRLSGGVNLHLFAGASGQDFVELGTAAGISLGPVRVDGTILYAPPQDSLGGSALYLSADASAGIPGTPFTVIAGIGRSSGRVDDAAAAARLRPDGSYVDARIGIQHVTGPVRLGARLTTTSIDAPVARHAGTRLVASAGIDF